MFIDKKVLEKRSIAVPLNLDSINTKLECSATGWLS